VQTYCRGLLRALPPEIDADLTALVQQRAQGEVPDGLSRRTRRDCDGVRRTIEGLRGVGPADLVHALDVDLPLRAGAPTVATVHDLSLFDEPTAFGWARRVGKQVTTRRSIRSADVVIAVSAFTAERVRAHFARDSRVVLDQQHSSRRPGHARFGVHRVQNELRCWRHIAGRRRVADR